MSGDDDDNIAKDCERWNDADKAALGFSQDVSYPAAHVADVRLSGSSGNPLEPPAPITWDMHTVIDTTNAESPKAYVEFDHTCFPAHQIKVNETSIYSYQPPRTDVGYRFDCLFLHINKLVGQTPTKAVPSQ